MKRGAWMLAAVVWAGCAGGAGAQGGDPKEGPPAGALPEVIAELDGEPITREEFLNDAVAWWGRETLEEIVLRRILVKASQRWKVTVTEKDLDERTDVELKLREEETRSKYKISLEEYLKQYGKTVEQFRAEVRANESFHRQILLESMVAYAYMTEVKVTVSLIVVRDEAKARDLRQKLKDGADFGKLAESESDDGISAQRGGKVPAFIRGMSMRGESFEDAAFALANVDDISPVVKTDRGFTIVKLNEKRPAQPQTYEALREDIRKVRMDRQSLDIFMRRLRSEFGNVVYKVEELKPKSK